MSLVNGKQWFVFRSNIRTPEKSDHQFRATVALFFSPYKFCLKDEIMKIMDKSAFQWYHFMGEHQMQWFQFYGSLWCRFLSLFAFIACDPIKLVGYSHAQHSIGSKDIDTSWCCCIHYIGNCLISVHIRPQMKLQKSDKNSVEVFECLGLGVFFLLFFFSSHVPVHSPNPDWL